MCGIAGLLGPYRPSPLQCEETLELMGRRGPDAKGIWQGKLSQFPLTLLHSRLAIIDLEERSNQPFQKQNLVLSYNGEIYNYQDIRQSLAHKGHVFTTESDTEVILEAYRRWGTGCVDHFEGMWAFALFDGNTNTLFLSRDRFGEKPLYYTYHNETLFFASETQFLWPLMGRRLPVNTRHIRRFLVQGYKSQHKTTETYYEGLSELAPASSILITKPGEVNPKPYWKLQYEPQDISLQEAEDTVADLVSEAIRLRLRADVPIAFCLSGGVDSTTLAAIASRKFNQEIAAYSIYDQDERYDESRNIEAVVADLHCTHHIRQTGRDHFIERMKDLIAYHDTPVATISFYVQSFLAEAIAEQGYKVAITGNGADELFTGYYDHYNFWLTGQKNKADYKEKLSDWQKGYGQFVRNPVLQDPECFVKNPDRRDHIYLNQDLFDDLLTTPLREEFSEKNYSDDLLHSRLLNEIRHETLPVLLKENDLIFMQHSIENRTPFLDRKLADYLFSIPSDYLIQDGYPKHLLRQAGQGHVIDQVRLDRQKRGFNAPLTSLINLKNKTTYEVFLEDSPIFDLIRKDRFETFLNQADERNSFSKFLFSFISVKMFLEHHHSMQIF